jgi:hypothetical protein
MLLLVGEPGADARLHPPRRPARAHIDTAGGPCRARSRPTSGVQGPGRAPEAKPSSAMTITTARTIRKHDNLDPIFFPADTDPQAMKAMNTQLIAGFSRVPAHPTADPGPGGCPRDPTGGLPTHARSDLAIRSPPPPSGQSSTRAPTRSCPNIPSPVGRRGRQHGPASRAGLAALPFDLTDCSITVGSRLVQRGDVRCADRASSATSTSTPRCAAISLGRGALPWRCPTRRVSPNGVAAGDMAGGCSRSGCDDRSEHPPDRTLRQDRRLAG